MSSKAKTDVINDNPFLESAYDETLHGPFVASHMVGDVPAMKVRNKAGLPSYVTAEGIYVVPNSKQGRPLLGIHEYNDVHNSAIRLSLQEFGLCCKACVEPNGYADSGQASYAKFLGDRRVLFSRIEEGIDVRRFIELPEFIELPSERDYTGQRIDTDEPVPANDERDAPEDAPTGEQVGPTG